MTLKYESIPSGMIECRSTIIWDEETKMAVWIDPTDDPAPIFSRIQNLGLLVKALLLTHGHADHAAGTFLAAKATGLDPQIHPADEALFLRAPQQAASWGMRVDWGPMKPLPLSHGQVLQIANGFALEVLHLPGHTPGGVAFYLANAGLAVVGDTLFCGSVGRTDLPGGNQAQLVKSLQDILYNLPPETIVIPGHGELTQIGRERMENPYVRAKNS